MNALVRELRRLPKVQLHCHLEGCVRPDTFAELASRYGVATEYRPHAAVADSIRRTADSIYHFSGFQEFLFKFAAVCRSLQRPGDYARILREYAEDAAFNGVMYAELMISPSVWSFFHRDLSIETIFEELAAAAAGIEGRQGVHIRFICDVTRNFGAESAIQTACLAVKMRKYRVVALGLGGDEANFPASLFKSAFETAKDGGLHLVAHAGEAAGAQSIQEAVVDLGAERIGHGIRALESDEVLELLKDRNITLEVCPTSNFRTGIVSNRDVHPLMELDRQGVPLMVDCDDPAIFGSDITHEYAFAASVGGAEAVSRFAHRAIAASFADEAEKHAMAAELTRATARN